MNTKNNKKKKLNICFLTYQNNKIAMHSTNKFNIITLKNKWLSDPIHAEFEEIL